MKINILLALLFPLVAATALAQEATEPKAVEMNELEQKLSDQLTGAQLRGSFTVSDDEPNEGGPQLRSESYDLTEVRKLANGQWLFKARIRYGKNDVTLPLTLPIEWAGDTPVVVVNDIGFPGLGTYSARVMFFKDRYAGYWQGKTHGGHLFGTIAKAAEKTEQPAPE